MIQPFSVAATLLAQRIVSMATDAEWTVEYPAAGGDLPVGITVDTVKDTTQSIPVAGPGEFAKCFFNDTVTAGGLVGSDSAGRGIPIADVQTTTGFTVLAAYVGISLEDVDATATIAQVYIMPGFVR